MNLWLGHGLEELFGSLALSHPELLQQPVCFASVDTDSGHSLAHRAARFIPDPRAPGVDARTLGSDAYWAVDGACAWARRRARVVNLSDAVHEAVVVDTPLPPVVAELVVQVGFGVFRSNRHARRTVRQRKE